jgi:hypothetical protein
MHREAKVGGRARAAAASFAVVVAGTLLMTGCTATSSTPSRPPSAEASKAAASPVAAEALDIAEAAVEQVEAKPGIRVLATGSARPTRVNTRSGAQTMIIRDELNMRIPRGTLVFTLYCSGEGTVMGAMTIDGTTQLGQDLPCANAGASSDDITLKQLEAGHQMTIRVVSVGDTRAAVSYAVVAH